MGRRTQIAVCGASRSDPELDFVAAEVGRLLAEAGAVVVCGGRDGIMSAVAGAAAEAGGEVIGVLMADDLDSGNSHLTHVVATGIGQARNLAVVASADAVIAIGGEWGTLSEIAFARRLGRPVFTLSSWELSGRGEMERAPGVEPAADPPEAVRRALESAAGR
ncbi:MAG TPA: TIGR00725 family protein [Solirubrobacterales bacterium]|nr:TIGR00725 family protein [Solirubrobacterales bacterium]